MEKSLDELIEFLVGEIAVKEARGASLLEIDGLVKSFYDNNARHEARTSLQHPSSPPAKGLSGTYQHVDQAFIFKVWKWLARHPDISVGAKKQFNERPLTDFWTRSDVAESTLKRSSDAAPRLFLTRKDRVHQAIFGQDQQSSKIHGKETALLSQIAASGPDGILQGELGRLTGQDKRSVPKRTDALRDKGFIIKATVYTRGTKTSRLILRKYAKESGDVGTDTVSRDRSPVPNTSEPRKVQHLVDRVIGHLTGETRVEIDDLASQVDMTGDAHRRVLTKIVRLMERSGLVKRVRMAIGPAAQAGDLKTYVQFLQHPTDLDLPPLEEGAISFDTSIEGLVADETAKLSSPILQGRTQTPEQETVVAQWNPDRGVANMLSDATIMAGESGLSNVNARNLITGPFVRRTLESLLTRVSYQGLMSQPSHLRHLGIVRATKLVGGILEYAHFSHGALPKAVRAKGVNFGSIPGAEHFFSSGEHVKHGGLAQGERENAQTDLFSLPAVDDTGSLANGGMATLTELINMTSASSILPRAGEPQISHNMLTEEALDKIGTHESPTIGRLSNKKARSVHVRANQEDKVSGRPRKFLRGTEKFWQYHFWKTRREAHGANDKLSSKHGTMSDPAGLALFNNRPEEFDETVLKAKSEGLPLPAHTEDISEEWMRRVRHVMDRQGSGAYVTPRGIVIGRVRYTSQLLIVRSDRLQSLDFSDKQASRFRFLTSNAAHSFSLTRTQRELLVSRKKVNRKVKGKPTSAEKKAGSKTDARGPRLGLFSETATASTPPTSREQIGSQSIPALTASEYQQLMDNTDSDSELEERPVPRAITTPKGINGSSPALSVSTVGSASWPRDGVRARTPAGVITSDRASAIGKTTKEISLTQKVVNALQGQAVEVAFQGPSSDLIRADKSSEDHDSIPNYQTRQPRKDGDNGVEEQIYSPRTKSGISSDQNLGEVENCLAAPTKPQPGLKAYTTNLTLKDQTTIRASPVKMGENRPNAPYPASSQPEPLIPQEHMEQSEERSSTMTGVLYPDARVDGTGHDDNDLLQSESEPLQPTGTSLSRDNKRRNLELESDEDARSPSAPGRQKPIVQRQSQKQSSKLCRRIVIELIMLANGAAPNDHITFRRVMTNRWQAGGGGDRPARKLVGNNIKTLSSNGKVQLIGFSFRGKGGVVVEKSILVLAGIDPTGQLVQDLKRKISDADPADYVPPEWQAETLPNLNMAGNIRSRVTTEGQFERPPIQELPVHFQKFAEPEHESEMLETPAPKRKRRQRRCTTSSESTTSSPHSTQSRGSSGPPQLGDMVPVTGSPSTTAFLTLKILRLGELSQVHTFNANLQEPEWMKILNRATEDRETESDTPVCLPAPPIRFDPLATLLHATALPTPVKKRRSGLRGGLKRKAKGKHFDPVTHEVLSEKAPSTLPESLYAILDTQEAHSLSLKIDPAVPEEDRFATEVDIVQEWEIRCEAEIYRRTVGWTFINHTAPAQHSTCSIAFWLLVDIRRHGALTLSPSLGSDSWPPFVNALEEAKTQELVELGVGDHTLVAPRARRKPRESRGNRRKRMLSPTSADTSTEPAAKRAKRGRANSFVSVDTESDGEFAPPSHQSQEKTRKLEASKLLKKMSKKEVDRVTITLICVGILSGGIDMTIDWSIAKPLLPELLQTTALLEECWVVIQEIKLSDVDDMTESFQERYIIALEAGNVPMVNPDDSTSTDWPAIVSWAVQNIGPEAEKQKSAILPATSAEFFSKHRLRLDETPSLRDTFRPTHPAKKIHKDKREDLHRATIFGIPLTPAPPTSTTASTAQIRSLILSIVLCPEPRYSQPLASAKWSSLAPTENEREILARPAFQSLLETDKLITLRSGVQNSTGPRKYKVTAKFWDLFGDKNCLITAAMLRDAGRYKSQILDEAFVKGELVALPKEARVASGEMLAVMQLMGIGAVEIRAGNDIPNSRYGVEWERVGYETRKLGKEVFSFGVGMGMTDGYVFGDGRGKGAIVDVPKGDPLRAAITPIWVDVYGELVEEMWEMVLGSAMGIVSSRPGVSVVEISKSLGGAVSVWELEFVLTWAEKSCFTKKTRSGKGWQTRDWWWLCLATGLNGEVV